MYHKISCPVLVLYNRKLITVKHMFLGAFVAQRSNRSERFQLWKVEVLDREIRTKFSFFYNENIFAKPTKLKYEIKTANLIFLLSLNGHA